MPRKFDEATMQSLDPKYQAKLLKVRAEGAEKRRLEKESADAGDPEAIAVRKARAIKAKQQRQERKRKQSMPSDPDESEIEATTPAARRKRPRLHSIDQSNPDGGDASGWMRGNLSATKRADADPPPYVLSENMPASEQAATAAEATPSSQPTARICRAPAQDIVDLCGSDEEGKLEVKHEIIKAETRNEKNMARVKEECSRTPSDGTDLTRTSSEGRASTRTTSDAQPAVDVEAEELKLRIHGIELAEQKVELQVKLLRLSSR